MVDEAVVADLAANTAGTMQTIAYTTTPDYKPIVGSFKHYVGPNQSRNYVLNVYQMGSGNPTVRATRYLLLVAQMRISLRQ